MKYSPVGNCFSERRRPTPLTVGASTGGPGSVSSICGARGAIGRSSPTASATRGLHAPAASTTHAAVRRSPSTTTVRTASPEAAS